MDVKIVEKPAFAVMGREGRGDGARGGQWIPPLWRDMQLHMSELAPLVRHDESGKPSGIWGAMSDCTRRFLPWDGEGLYLAGCETDENAVAPEGWAKWVIPAFRYLTVPCTPQSYGSVFQQILFRYMPEHGYTLAGAVQEYYDPQDSEGQMRLYFPIERL